MNQQIVSDIRAHFLEVFEEEPSIFRSPGRVNIIGEHTDYNNGFVLPAAIDKAIYVGISPRADDQVKLVSLEFNDRFETRLGEMKPVKQGWPNYVMGVAAQLIAKGYQLSGFNAVLSGDVPIGSGLSSSAAVECATALALSQVFDLHLQKLDLALTAQKAEHEFAGVMCGIMDQFASVFGKKDHVIRLDCQSLDYQYVPLNLSGYCILLLNTNVKHSLASSAYNTRRQQCEEGVRLVAQKYPAVKSLRDVTLEQLDECVKNVDPEVYRKCRFVVEENQRLLDGCRDLEAGDLKALGLRMYGSHDGLSKDYEVSCKELDFLVDQVRNRPDVLGARMMGGGFGGCTINLVREDAVETLVKEISPLYKQAMGLDLSYYVARVDEGSCAVKLAARASSEGQ